MWEEIIVQIPQVTRELLTNTDLGLWDGEQYELQAT